MTEIFDNTAKYYSKYRDNYPRELFEFLREISPDNKLAVDLGCGTGQVAIPVSKYFDKVMASDISSDMIKEASENSSEIKNIEWTVAKSEDVLLEKNSVDLITIAQAFHWMDKDLIIKNAKTSLKNNGVFALISAASLWNGISEWEIEIKKLIQSFLGEERKAGENKSFPKDTVSYEDRLKNAFGNVTTQTFKMKRIYDYDSLLGYLYSTSFSKKELYGDKYEQFETELKTIFDEYENNGEIFVDKNLDLIYSINN